MKHLQAEKDIFSALMAILGGGSGDAVLHAGTTAPPPPRAKLSLTAQQKVVGALAATPLPTAQAAKLVQPALVPRASRNLLHSSLNPHNVSDRRCSLVHRLTDPSSSRQGLKISICLEELHWYFTEACIFTNSYLHYFHCFYVHPNEAFFCKSISTSPHGIHTPSPTPLPRDIHPPAAGSQENSQRPRQHRQKGRLKRSRSLMLQEN